ncbi:hypothetical protein KCU86_g35, partial [Aureobasidium melanogenum]
MADGHITWRHAAARGCVFSTEKRTLVALIHVESLWGWMQILCLWCWENWDEERDAPDPEDECRWLVQHGAFSRLWIYLRNREDRLFEGEFVEFSILLEPHKPASPSILEHDKEGKVPLYHPALSA